MDFSCTRIFPPPWKQMTLFFFAILCLTPLRHKTRSVTEDLEKPVMVSEVSAKAVWSLWMIHIYEMEQIH